MIIRSTIFVIMLLLASSEALAAEPSCLLVDTSLSCAQLNGYTTSANFERDCGTKLPNGTSCCCPASAPSIASRFSPKTIIIFSLVGVFAILTIGILIFRKNDQD